MGAFPAKHPFLFSAAGRPVYKCNIPSFLTYIVLTVIFYIKPIYNYLVMNIPLIRYLDNKCI